MAFCLNLIVLLAFGSIVATSVPRFYIPNVALDWIGAVEYCNRLNMRLAVVDSQSKHDAVVALIKDSCANKSGGSNVWIGANDMVKQGTYVWHATGEKVDYTNWSPNNPDNYQGAEHCAEIAFRDYTQWTWTWNDRRCGSLSNFVCEF